MRARVADLAFGVENLADKDIAGRVDAAFRGGVEHQQSFNRDGQDGQDRESDALNCILFILCIDVLYSGEAFEFELGSAEVDEEPYVDARGFQVVDDLGLVLRRKRFHGLDFHDDDVLDKQVGIEVTDAFTAKQHSDRFLAGDGQTLLLKCEPQGVVINRLEKACAEFVDHLERAADDGLRQLLVSHPVHQC